MKKTLILLLFSLSMTAQYTQFNSSAAPYFDLNYSLSFDDSLENPILNIVTEIKYDRLSFTKLDKSNYHAKYLLKLYIKNTKTEENYDKLNQQIEITVDEFNKTNSRKLISKVEHSKELLEGNYIILASLYDMNSTKIFYTNKKVNIKSSNLKRMMVNNFQIYSKDSASTEFKVSYQKNFPKLDGKIRFNFLINKIQPDIVGQDVVVGFYIRNESQKNVFEKDSIVSIKDRETKEFSFVFDKMALKGIEFEYLVKIRYKDEVLDEEKGTFSYSWNLHPNNKNQMRIALDQMHYIMDQDTVNKYKEAAIELSIEKFKLFWRNMSVTKSDLEAASLTREYFKRIMNANKYFKRFSFPGWKTDRGRIYVKFGEPDEIYTFRRSEGQYAPPRNYLVWRYYNERKTFTFYDFDNFEDYRLTDESRMEEYQ